jgi:hypothetical protein
LVRGVDLKMSLNPHVTDENERKKVDGPGMQYNSQVVLYEAYESIAA